MKKFALLITLIFFIAAGVFAQQKYALVIGNGNYVNTTKLNNPVNDANDMASALQGLGWSVDKLLNGTQDQMVNAVMQLKRRLSASRDSYGFLFYAGHGIQSGGENYLIPVDANIPSENFLRNRTVSVQEMLDELNDAGNEFNVVVLDACRDNPFSWKRSGSRGLSVIGAQPADSILVFATAAGSTAADGNGRNGLFTTHLLNNLKQTDLEVTEVFRRTGADVAKASNNQQRPAVYNQFYGTAYLGKKPQASAQTAQPAPTVQPAQPQQTVTTAVQTSQVTTMIPQSAARKENTIPSNMVRINGGTFTMGSPDKEPGHQKDEAQHQVTVSGFYIGKYEVTHKEYEDIMGIRNYVSFRGDNLPVVDVTWYDAIEYCNKRSEKEGLTPAYIINSDNITWNRNANGYRLPTEAEWEYACRAGTTTPFSIGDKINTSQANFNSRNKGVFRRKTTPIGSFAPNAWGLYDMHGNVEELCWDLYADYPSGQQTDPTGPATGAERVKRGGCWNGYEHSIRSAYRGSFNPKTSSYDVGFRVVRNVQ